MDLLVQCAVSLTLTRQIAGALLERTVIMQLGKWSSATPRLTMCPPQGSPLSPVLCNVYTKGLADLNQKGLSRVLTLADDRLVIIHIIYSVRESTVESHLLWYSGPTEKR